MAEPTVAAGFARGLFEFALKKGAAREALERDSGLRLEDLSDQNRRVPFARYVALMRAAKALTGDPALALHYGEQVDIAKVSIVGLIGQASETMLEAFQALNRFVRLIVETDNADGGDRFQLVRDKQGLWMIDARLNPHAFPELTESAFAQLIQSPRRVHHDAGLVKAVHFTHEDPGYRAEYERIFEAPVVFGSDRNGALLDEGWINRRVERLPPYAGDLLNAHAETLLADLDSSKTVRGQVEKLLTPLLPTGEASMDTVAAKMGLSRQTLFRRLKAEGVTFEQVLDDLRRRLALHYLNDKKVSVAEASYRLGFSDPAAFSRAFKRWTGASPRMAKAG